MKRSLHLLALIILAATWLAVPVSQARELTFEERVQAQEAIERVYYSHQIAATKPFEETVPGPVLEAKVRKYLKQSVALETSWSTSITAEALRRELERMARGTGMPGRLRELFAALDDDPLLIQECLARPALVGRLVHSFFAYDERLHGAARREAEALRAALQNGWIDPWADHPRRTVFDLVRIDANARRGAHKLSSGHGTEAGPVELAPEDYERERALLPDAAGEISPIREDRERFIVSVLLEEEPHRLHVARFAVAKRSCDAWWSEIEADLAEHSVVAVTSGPDPIAGLVESLKTRAGRFDRSTRGGWEANGAPCVADDTWDNGVLDDGPFPHGVPLSVWSGSELIVWGGERYDSATDTWAPISTENATPFQYAGTTIWTGSHMVVWGGGGSDPTSVGGRYDPVTDTWAPITTVNAPSPRFDHTAVWTGSQMIVWGGYSDGEFLGDGGRYDPSTDTWTSMSAEGHTRSLHSAIWTGSEMIVWGGFGYELVILNSGGRYDPATDTWTPTSQTNAPEGRGLHSAVWTGDRMLVWGGSVNSSTGGSYDPVADTWTPTSTLNAPSPRERHTAVWTGSHMVVWGGGVDFAPLEVFDTGGVYDPTSDTWTPTTTTNAPLARGYHTAAWMGDRMIVWGGYGEGGDLASGGRYDPVTDSWTPTYWTNRPESRELHTMVWTGNRMIVWGGRALWSNRTNTGGVYDLVTDTWTPTSTIDVPSGRFNHTAVWTGTSMVVWGGVADVGLVDTGGRYAPQSNTWTPTSTANTPDPRQNHTAVWTDNEMIVWGGNISSQNDPGFETGGRYDPETDSWQETSTVHTPGGRHRHTAVWTGDEMIVWGGRNDTNPGLDTGGRYDPETDTWLPPPTKVDAPFAREEHTAVWSGDEMIVWGGSDDALPLASGGRYGPGTNTWVATSMSGAPEARVDHTTVWTGDEMIVWGGYGTRPLATGGRYNPVVDTWTTTSMTDAPSGRYYHTAVWTGGFMIVWGGDDQFAGGRYALGHSVDNDGDGFSECAGDCNDGNPEVLPGALEICDGLDNDCSGLADDLDADQDGSGICEDCNDGDATVFPDAPEINDGVDNQCPGNTGYGVTDETSSESGFYNPDDRNEYSWPAQAGALGYEVARADVTDFSVGCTMFGPMPQTFLVDDEPLASGEIRFYMNRSFAPNLGSWGQDSAGVERTVPCD